jgi:hypothetical protein
MRGDYSRPPPGLKILLTPFSLGQFVHAYPGEGPFSKPNREDNVTVSAFFLTLMILTDPSGNLTIRIANTAAVPNDVLSRTKTEVQRIYREAGISIVWAREGEATLANRFEAIVVIAPKCVNRNTCQTTSALGTALGSEGQGVRRVYMFLDRVYEMALKFQKRISITEPEAVVLGHALAHELGHLLLPPGHTASGVMASELDLASMKQATRGDLLFTAEQAAFMRVILLSAGSTRAATKP